MSRLIRLWREKVDAFEYGQIPSPTWPLRSRNFIKHPVSMSAARFTGMLFVTLTRLDIYSGGANFIPSR